jgi:FtsZ-interacting cell division protein ZipA
MRIQIKNKVSLVLILVAGASLVSMLGTLRIDYIINHTLYNYGLQFSYNWAIPYWTMAGIVFSMGWLIILTSIAFELHLLMRWLHKPPKPETVSAQQEPALSEAATTEAASTEKPEEEEVKTTAPAEEAEEELSEFRVLQEEPVENEAPGTEAAPSEKPEEEEVKTTEVVAEPGGQSEESQKLQEEPAQTETPTEATPGGHQEQAQNETPRTEAGPTEKPEQKEAKTTEAAMKDEDEWNELWVLLGETPEATNEKVERKKADDKPKNE